MECWKQIGVILLPSLLFGLSFSSFNYCLDVRIDDPSDCYDHKDCFPGTILNDILITRADLGWLSLTTLTGGFLGSVCLSSQRMQDYGRKKIIQWNVWIYLLGTIASCLPMKSALFIGEFLLGMATGMTRVVIPMLLWEISPKLMRGKYVVWHQIVGASAFIILMPLRDVVVRYMPHGWILLRGINLIPIGLFFYFNDRYLVESPLWLLSNNREPEALNHLFSLRSEVITSPVLAEELSEMSKDDQEPKSKRYDPDLKSSTFLLLKKSPWGQLFHFHKESVVAGVGLAITKSLTGVTLILYLSRQNGSPTRFTPVTLFVAAILLFFIVEKIPRKIIILRGANLMTVSLLLFSICFVTDRRPIELDVLNGIATTLYAFGYAFGLSIVNDLVLCELSKTKLRLKLLSLCISVNWVVNIILAIIFPDGYIYDNVDVERERSQAAVRCSIYAGICFSCTLFIIFFVPETSKRDFYAEHSPPHEEIS